MKTLHQLVSESLRYVNRETSYAYVDYYLSWAIEIDQEMRQQDILRAEAYAQNDNNFLPIDDDLPF